MRKRNISFLIVLSFFVSSMAQQKLSYPKAATVDTVDEYFGTKVADPYRWMENDNSAATLEWERAENKITKEYLGKIPFRGGLLKCMTGMADYEKYSEVDKHGDKYFYFKNNGLQNQSVYYVVDKLVGGTPRVFLDPNKLSDDGTVALRGVYFSNSNDYVAYVTSKSGSDWEEINVMDVNGVKKLTDHITWVKTPIVSWYKDGFYYSAYDAPEKGQELTGVNTNHKVYYHKLGTLQSDDKLVYQNPQYPKRFYAIITTKDETVAFLNEDGDNTGNTLFFRDLRKDNSQFVRMTYDNNHIYTPIEVIDSTIYILTDKDASNGHIMVADISKPDIKDWRELIPETKDNLLGANIIGGRLFITYQKDAYDHVFIYSLDGKKQNEIKLPSLGSAEFTGEKDSKDCFFSFTSFTMPTTIFKYDIDNNSYKPIFAPKLSFNPNEYVVEQIFFPSKDGTKIPMSLVYKKGMKRNGNTPVLMYGYGGFNISVPPSYSSSRMPFIENGGIYVYVNLRGGNEYGEKWHLAGTKMHKQNVFDDFISAAEYLIKNKYTNKNKIAILGGSNGGLLVGACMTQRPDLFRVAVPQVGVMDMLRYHKFTIGWNWAGDYGTSADSKEMFEYLKGYSPLHNLKPGVKYPATLVTTADHDDRVVPAHSFKFAATLQRCNAGNNPTLIRIDSKAGHGGGKPMSKVLEEQTDIYSFIMFNLGMKPKF